MDKQTIGENAKKTIFRSRSWTKKELMLAYGISYVQLRRWLLLIPNFMNSEHLKKVRKFTPSQANRIFDHVGEPF